MDTLTMDLLTLLGVVALIFANGFFVATEFALVSVRRSRIEQLVATGNARARSAQAALNDLGRYIAATQVGVTMASLALGWIGEPVVERLLQPLFGWLPAAAAATAKHSVSALLAFCLITFLHVAFGELVPKSVALQRGERIALWVAGPMRLLMALFRPAVWSLNGMANVTLRMFGLQPAGELDAVHSSEELRFIVRQSRRAGVLGEVGSQLVERSLRVLDLNAADVMVPRTDLVALDVTLPVEELLDRAAGSHHQQLPVYEGTLDNIIGFLHVQDVFQHLQRSKEPFDIRKQVRAPLFVPETVRLDDLLRSFRQGHRRVAVVTDEHGGVAGLVTLDDVVEEVFGEVPEATKVHSPDIQELPDGRLRVRGDVRLRELNDRFGWALEAGQADTIAGYVMDRLDRLPRVGENVETPHGIVTVETMERQRIVQVAITRKAR
jgi:putative hemolysin